MFGMFRPAIIKLVIKGRENWNEEEARDLVKRLPVTLTILKLIKLLLRTCGKFSDKEQALIWSVCTVAFNGAFRGEENERVFFPF